MLLWFSTSYPTLQRAGGGDGGGGRASDSGRLVVDERPATLAVMEAVQPGPRVKSALPLHVDGEWTGKIRTGWNQW